MLKAYDVNNEGTLLTFLHDPVEQVFVFVNVFLHLFDLIFLQILCFVTITYNSIEFLFYFHVWNPGSKHCKYLYCTENKLEKEMRFLR